MNALGVQKGKKLQHWRKNQEIRTKTRPLMRLRFSGAEIRFGIVP
jgi:hypothetical protein